MHSGWWVSLEGAERELRDLAMHFDDPDFEIVEDAGTFYLSSMDFSEFDNSEQVRELARELVAAASGSLAVKFGRFDPPRVGNVVLVDEAGAKQHHVIVSSAIRLHFEASAQIERVREDGSVDVVELVAPPPQTRAWARHARSDSDTKDVLAILGREDVRWHDLYHVFEVVEADVGDMMFTKRWVTEAEVRRFKHTANSRMAIGRDARHGHQKYDRPKKPLAFPEARALVLTLVRTWLDMKVPPPPPRELVVEVRDPNSKSAAVGKGERDDKTAT